VPISSPAPSDPAVDVVAIAKAYGSGESAFNVFEDLSFSLSRNERIGIFGANGSGKSTVLRIIAGLTAPDSGQIRYANGVDDSVGYVFQSYEQSLMPWLRCIDNIALPLYTRYGMGRAPARERVRQYLAEMDIELPLERYPYQMSGGQKQLAVIARALVIEPQLLLLDEPFASLDYLHRLSMFALLERDWQAKPKATIFISHDVDEALLASDRLLVLGDEPSRIVDVVEVPLPRPRGVAAISLPEFGELRRRVLSHFPVPAE
jgi:NitT/TauT family transport system ATP-binding protein